ncbi:MAG TPA: cation diffusion facilitator family transporter [Mobilitalea sp.]|nr:cation diffusion facilitator family transporter [Mobilitalea sp.]
MVAFLILQVGLSLLQSSFQKVLHPEALTFNPILVGILCVSVLMKVWMMLFNRKLGRRINSTVMIATSADSRNDVVVTTGTIISTLIAGLSGLKMDGYMGVLVSLFVMFSGFKIAKDTLEPLLGQAVDRDIYEKITNMVQSYEGIVGTHDLIIHNYGPTQRLATIHAEVPNDLDFEKAHEIIDQIEKDVKDKLDIFLVIHTDPIEINDVIVLEKKELVLNIIKRLEGKASIHDFRIINGERQINLIFDLVIPYSYSKYQKQNLITSITEEVAKLNTRHQCIINMENSFIAEE